MATILVVDDEPDLRELILRILEIDGHTIVLAENGEAGLAAAAEDPPDLVILDVMMPRMDGWDVLARLKEHDDPAVRTVPVLMLTALGELQDQARGGIEGAVQWLTKPFKVDELLDAVRGALEEPELPQRRRAQRRGLEQLARIERSDAGASAPTPGPRLTHLERPAVAPERARRDAIRKGMVGLTDTQRRTVEAVANGSVKEAAGTLGVSSSSVYATLRRCARRLGVASVAELLAAVRRDPRRG